MAFDMMPRASSSSPRPRAIEQSGAPPVPQRFVKAVTIVMIGKHKPTPVSAMTPSSPIRPMNMRSTTLYRRCDTCAMTSGIAMRVMFADILPLVKSRELDFMKPKTCSFCFFSL